MIICKTFFKSIFILFTILCHQACGQQTADSSNLDSPSLNTLIGVGAQQLDQYLPLLTDKKIAVVVNQTSLVGQNHLVDTLLSLDHDIIKIFAPEHGFRGKADAGEHVNDGIDRKTQLPIISLYGKNKKPSSAQLKGVDILLFDIQDVGARFYTYISTLHYIMEAGAENDIPVVVLDRANPNAHYIDGPLLQPALKSFVGMHPVPVVYGMTIGEYALMINGEQWLANGLKARLTVIPCTNYDHGLVYDLPVKPSPNLPTQRSIALYPSLCFFEGTHVSAGRGTALPFELFGHPSLDLYHHSFVPKSTAGAKYPKHENNTCFGLDLSAIPVDTIRASKQLELSYLIDSYKILTEKQQAFFLDNNFFDKLAGTYQLREQISSGTSIKDIRASWQNDIEGFKKIRKKYLLYPD